MTAAVHPASDAPDSASDPNDILHQRLSSLNVLRLEPATPSRGEPLFEPEMEPRRLERAFLESERELVARRASTAPSDPVGFLAWFEDLRECGPGQNDLLFPWLAARATADEVRWFLAQEVAGEAGFDDLVAMTQIKMPTRVKLELARNYWDEMGRGNETAMHGPMLTRVAEALDVRAGMHGIVWEARALGNLLVGLAANRDWAYHAIGALGVVELTAPGRAVQVTQALKRLRVEPNARRYYSLHATIDLRHSEAWNREIIAPLVESDASLARPIAEGALMRLNAGLRCFERYRKELGVIS